MIQSNEIIVDSFAGGGGASMGIELALGRSPDIAINHNGKALAIHMANHATTQHYREDVWQVDPVEACAGRPVGLAWFSPDCKHFSRAKGGKPVNKKVRGLAWSVTRWAKAVRPRVICLENVEEFETWGPLLPDGTPCPAREGLTFRRWVNKLRSYGYEVQWRDLTACDFGAPTKRKRLFLIARCDGQPIVWPEPTHGPGRLPYRTAAECINWTIPCPSIFDRKIPLVEKTLARIARGIRKFVIDTDRPYLVPGPAAAAMIQAGYGEREGQAPRVLDIQAPLGTVVAGGNKFALVTAFLAKHYGGHTTPGQSLELPMSTITTQDHHALVTASLGVDQREQVRAFLLKYYGVGDGQQLSMPLHTITTKHRFGLVTVNGEGHCISDIGMRMLVARELFNAQGFPATYQIDVEYEGKPLSQSDQIAACGNSVSPEMARALVLANCGEPARAEVAA